MIWFKKKKNETVKVAESVSYEVGKHSRDKRQAVDKANRTAEGLKQSIRRNNFTLNVTIAGKS